MTEDTNNTIEQLTQGQIDCLLLVHQHLTSKEIGLRLGISPHTVDQRIRAALRILGCNRRSQAAKLVASSRSQERAFLLPRSVAEPFVQHQANWLEGKSRKSIPVPFSTQDHPSNVMSVRFRLFWIVAIASGSAFSAGMYLAGLESLSRLIQS
ncbi:helix-turn-helix transcriptional regulator [Sphingomonas sp.]|uniref:response regulator transcription factor n=1 Tax=Sphingomonas sp. TaxID=28214 RepID=UPI001827B06E|nr:helix-turn-helix transcriptional regulator [Sphingomonas sp.]MBA3512626.1 helix-turn-helix transcriptional regulator [Sphingomonas sp.]